MAIPFDAGAIDTLVMLPAPADAVDRYDMVTPALGQNKQSDPESSPVGFMFKDSVYLPEGREAIEYTISEMDRFGIERGLVDITIDPLGSAALSEHADRFVGAVTVDPNLGMDAVREIVRAHNEQGVKAVSVIPPILNPPVAIDDRRMYPIYSKCVELNLPIFIPVGVPGPRVPLASQKVELLDEVCYFFPELKIVMRHGAQPWADMAVMLMAKWPNLYFSTSAYAPKYYPKPIIEYANTRGADKVMFGGYFGVGLHWERVFAELEQLPLREHVWSKFMRGNAANVLGL